MALVWIMIPGLGFFYSGLLRRKNALSMIFLGVVVLAVVSFQWFFWGFSLAFSETGSKFIGDLSMFSPLVLSYLHLTQLIPEYFSLMGVLEKPSIGSTRIPALLFCIYQGMFAAITYVLPLFYIHQSNKNKNKTKKTHQPFPPAP